ncbi:MAG: UTP--glucose-1-phosphate uridylyltransferase [Leptospiraceae bacterium]|nr:UTP--glucose-1-phosphate uridylyltransferase [Leptospiraceae bacterium]MCP5510928.1 UTP--glucose-1-phosphate uridylyltransferase [Leptospiraceae bacterium]
MKKENLSDVLIEDFLKKVDKVRKGETGKVVWNTIGDLDPETDEISLETLRKTRQPKSENLKKLVVIKLNGGLGTSMGLSKAKSLIKIKENKSFLEIIASQIQYYRKKFNVEIPLILMDSYNTQSDCARELGSIGFSQTIPTSFLQNKVPRLRQSDLSPIETEDKKDEWCPPGHGDIYLSLKETGILKSLLEKGYEYAFISNGDNLGATIEPYILDYLLEEQLDFAMEMTPKTLADKKGGAIYRKMIDGKFMGLELLETAQVPDEHEHEFSGMGKFRTFSTNNLWINLKALESRLSKGLMELSLIVNPKSVAGIDVLQLETAMGSAIGNFQKTKGIIIPRDRFAPVKKCEDTLIRMSDAYTLNEDFSLTMSEVRKSKNLSENLISLEDKYYKKVKEFTELFPEIPSLVESTSFTVKGQVLFDKKIKIIGDVTIDNPTGGLKKISELGKDILENETVVL